MTIWKKRIVRHNYTIIELLVVLVIAGLLTGITMSGIKGALGRQGATGAVRTLAAKISLAQSFAVSKNRYVALLMPDDDGFNADFTGSPIKNDNTANFDDNFWFTQNRLCYVTKDTSGIYNFERWVNGYEWQKLPSKTVAFIADGTIGTDDSTPAQVEKIDGTTGKNCSAIIFKPSGSLVSAKNVIIRVYRADYISKYSTTNFLWQNKKDTSKGWKIGIRGFTGRAKFSLGGENVFE